MMFEVVVSTLHRRIDSMERGYSPFEKKVPFTYLYIPDPNPGNYADMNKTISHHILTINTVTSPTINRERERLCTDSHRHTSDNAIRTRAA